MSQSTTSVCVQCKHSIAEKSDHLCWFENHFCNILCLEKYNYDQKCRSCAQCKRTISSVTSAAAKASPAEENVLMLKSSPSNPLCCSLDCMNQFLEEHVLCAYCSVELETNNLPPSDANRKETVAFCSLECQRRMNIHLNMKSVAKCSNCKRMKNIQMGLVEDDNQYLACSQKCFNELKEKLNVKNGEQ